MLVFLEQVSTVAGSLFHSSSSFALLFVSVFPCWLLDLSVLYAMMDLRCFICKACNFLAHFSYVVITAS